MPRLVGIILFLALSLQLVAKLGIVALYQINKEYIAKNLCENRDKPQMKCCGKCYLKKQLKKAEDSEKSDNPTSKSETFQAVAFLLPDRWQYTITLADIEFLQHNSLYRSISGIDSLKDIFHPPQSAC